MKYKKSHFRFTKQERSGIFFLLFLIILVQTSFWLYREYSISNSGPLILDDETQKQIEELKSQSLQSDSLKIFPFNPNYITDYKGYTLGLSVEEIDRLHDFRKKNKFVNSAEEFQEITKVSDSILNIISPYFKFPDWVKTPKENKEKIKTYDRKDESASNQVSDLNQVTINELKKISGVGDILSERIVKFRDRLGGFLINEQLYDVYALPPEVAQAILKRYKVVEPPAIIKVNINTATARELSKLVYIQNNVAQEIVRYREINGSINSFDELLDIPGFPKDRIDRIPLYLSLKK